MMRVELPREIANAIRAHARSSPRVEVCGLIGRAGTGEMRAYAVENAAQTPEISFEMDARAQLDAMREMRRRGEALWGIYHSHPRTEAEPSARDLAMAAYPEAVYLIVSLARAASPDIAAFHIRGGKALRLALTGIS